MITVYSIPIALLCTAWAVGLVLNFLFERIERAESPPSPNETALGQPATTYGVTR
jgi:hypothetical protein